MSARSGGKVWLDRQRNLTLARLIKSGGAGSVYLLAESPAQVAKLYHAHMDLASYRRKIDAMLRLSPELPDQIESGRRYVQIAWPQAPLQDARGRFIGFAMPTLDIQQTAELEEILQERQARAAGLPTGLGAKITLAANLSGVIAALHQQHHYVVDLKPVNLRFYRDSLYIAMLDCDGFSIQGESERFPAQQFTVDYLAPELQGGGLTAAGEEAQDRFALAVVIFQLLNFGIHPFSGRPANAQVPTDLPGRIRGRYYAYGLRAHKAISPNPVSGHAQMPAELRQMFDSAFAGQPGTRPAPAEWARVLCEYALRTSQRLQVCGADPSHQHFAGLACAACARGALIAGAASAAAAATAAQAGARRKAGRGKRGRQAATRQQGLQQVPQPLAQAIQATMGQAQAPVAPSAANTPTRGGAGVGAVIAVSIFIMVGALVLSGRLDSSKSTPVAPDAAEAALPLEWSRDARAERSSSLASGRAEIRGIIEAVAAGRLDTIQFDLLRLKAQVPVSAPGSLMEYKRDQASYRNTLREARMAVARAQGGTLAAEAELEKHYDQHRDLLASDPGASFVAAELGEYHLLHKEPVAARLYFEQAVWGNPGGAVGWDGLGAVALRAQRDKEAVACFAIARWRTTMDDAGALNVFLPRLRLRLMSDQKRWEGANHAAEELAAKLAELPPVANRGASVDPVSQQRHPARYASELEPQAAGVVELEIRLDAAGDPIRIKVATSSGRRALDQAALDAARNWRYSPAVWQGALINDTILVPVIFAAT
ncbi:TonB family protein [Cupriavidus basilensis]|uniref:TonB family protein n=1 Tax=Cupriavidus basilensis TaxID=68895 RepID=A0ABT6AMX3_9BURK|nr:TonB family protein [Cupriavidus basilensis]MDF3833975.1 TonB family protein [Cupriavidus basilensis]